MAIGAYGRKVFATSDRRILTFRDFTYTAAARFAEHETLQTKPKTEYLGPGLDDVTFTIQLDISMGINVRKELESWRKMVGSGNVERLIIGRRRLGKGLWRLNGCSEAWGIVTNQGAITRASMDITLREYV